MLKEYLDVETYEAIVKSFNFNDITEIRMRLNQRLIVAIKNKKYYLKNSNDEFIDVTKIMLENFIRKISENSIYAYNDNIINGYITLKNGIRVGLAGSVVYENGEPKTIKDFNSANIRIPHLIKNCSVPAFDFLVDEDVKNTLIISAPGAGKTTFLRDFIMQLSERKICKNVLVVDERNEICSHSEGEKGMCLGGFCDVYTNCTKEFGFKNGIRSMAPDVIFTDEIDLELDLKTIKQAINSGVNIVATVHAKNLTQLRQKEEFEDVLRKKYFSRFVVLNSDNGPGTLAEIYDEKLNCLYCKM